MQGTEEWFAARRGKITASRLGDLMATTKSGPAASRKNYLAELVCERLTGTTQERFESPAMRWGTETEPLARSAYEASTGRLVEEVGFIDHPDIPYFGCSPDGLVGDDGGIEIKCPNTATHIEFLLNPKLPRDYHLQVQAALFCTGRNWWHFVSFDPRLPPNLQLTIVTVAPDLHLFSEIRYAVNEANEEIEKTVEALRRLT